MTQLFSPVMKEYGARLWGTGKTPEDVGIINQKGLNRKVRPVVCVHVSREANAMIVLLQHIFDSVQASLKRLQVDYIDLLQCTYAHSVLWDHIADFADRPSL